MKRLPLAVHLFKASAKTIVRSPSLLLPPTTALLIFVAAAYAWIKLVTRLFGDTNTLFTGLASFIPLFVLIQILTTISEAVSSITALNALQTGKPRLGRAIANTCKRLPALLGWSMYKLLLAVTVGIVGSGGDASFIAGNTFLSTKSAASSFTIAIAMYEGSSLREAQQKSIALVKEHDVWQTTRATSLYGIPVAIVLLVALFACLATEWQKPVFITSVVVITGMFIKLSVLQKLVRAEILKSRMESD